MKTGLKVAAAMMVIMSGTVIAAPFSVSSADMRDGQTLAQTHWFGGFGCTGGNISPQIAWKNAPAGTRSFAVTAYDPDAPTGSGWWHWTVVNIAQQVTGLALAPETKITLNCPPGRYRGAMTLAMRVLAARVRPPEINRIATALRYGRLIPRRCPLMARPAGR
ncbi:putative outer membrane protein [Klebsiella michiganensis]|nr:putative outer membrane protein [Klebsiella michiganensis]